MKITKFLNLAFSKKNLKTQLVYNPKRKLLLIDYVSYTRIDVFKDKFESVFKIFEREEEKEVDLQIIAEFLEKLTKKQNSYKVGCLVGVPAQKIAVYIKNKI